jgi:hypothetical protein
MAHGTYSSYFHVCFYFVFILDIYFLYFYCYFPCILLIPNLDMGKIIVPLVLPTTDANAANVLVRYDLSHVLLHFILFYTILMRRVSSSSPILAPLRCDPVSHAV